MDVAGWPEPVVDLYATLLSWGFRVLATRRGGMGGIEVEMAGLVTDRSRKVSAAVNINADRGIWMLTLSFGDMNRGITPGAWKAYLDGESMEERSLAEQVSFIRDRIHEMAAAVKRNPKVESELIRVGDDFMRRKLGL